MGKANGCVRMVAGFIFGFAVLAVALAAIGSAAIGLFEYWINLSWAANVVFQFEPRALLLTAPVLAVIALGAPFVVAAVLRRR